MNANLGIDRQNAPSDLIRQFPAIDRDDRPIQVVDTGRTCPSTTVEHAPTLLGVVGPDGRVHYVTPALPLDDEFRHKAAKAGAAEARFRFAGPCVERGCQQWTGTRCGVIDSLLDQVEHDLETALRPCTVRRECRWFAQRGAAACRACPWVITDSRREGD